VPHPDRSGFQKKDTGRTDVLGDCFRPGGKTFLDFCDEGALDMDAVPGSEIADHLSWATPPSGRQRFLNLVRAYLLLTHNVSAKS
jgi:hypothetical protein